MQDTLEGVQMSLWGNKTPLVLDLRVPDQDMGGNRSGWGSFEGGKFETCRG